MDDLDIVREFLVESNENLARLDQEIVVLEQRPDDAELLASVFRTFHTIKGSCGFLGFHALEELTHVTEDLLSQIRNGRQSLTPELISLILRGVDDVKHELAVIEKTGAESGDSHDALRRQFQAACERKPVAPPPPVSVEIESSGAQKNSVADSTIRVDVGLLDKLMNLVGELVLTRNQILQGAAAHEDAASNSISQRLNLITTELQEGVMKTRMQPIGVVWKNLPRVVRDLAAASNKRIVLEMEGADTEVDKTIIEAIKDPLTHLVRNCCDHGIESPAARAAHGKPGQGVISLRAYHEGGQVNIEIADDGGGIDTGRLKQKAVNKGLLRAEKVESMSERELLNLVFLPGLSTADQVTNISGRGVGMDVVRTNIERIGGTIDLASRLGRGTTARLKIPLTLAIIPGLVVTSGGEKFIIPQVSLLELIRLEGDGGMRLIENIEGTRVYRRRGALLPLVYLCEALQLLPEQQDDVVNIVVLQAEDRQFGLVVDGISDTQEIVVKPLGAQLKGLTCYAGSTILGDGSVALILDVLGIAQRTSVVSERREQARADAEGKTAARVQSQSLLLFRSGNLNRLAVPLALVARLEEFPRAKIEQAGGSPVVQYRGQILPLVPLDTILDPQAVPDFQAKETVQVIVFCDGDRQIGVIVDEILDILEDEISVRKSTHRAGLLGSAVVGGKLADFLDLPAIIRSVDEHWLSGTSRNSGDTILVAEPSAFSRALIRMHLEMNGHRVIEAADTREALDGLAREKVDAVAAALDLPDAGGLALLERMREQPGLRRIPALALASCAEELRAPNGRQPDFERYEMKFDCAATGRALAQLTGSAMAAATAGSGNGDGHEH